MLGVGRGEVAFGILIRLPNEFHLKNELPTVSQKLLSEGGRGNIGGGMWPVGRKAYRFGVLSALLWYLIFYKQRTSCKPNE